MMRPCNACGETYEAKRSTSKYCSSSCRVRASRGGAEVVEIPAPPAAEADGDVGPVTTATLKALAEADRLEHPMGAAALALARRVDFPGLDTGSAFAAVVRQLEATLAAATKGAAAATAPGMLQDELAARRAAQGA